MGEPDEPDEIQAFPPPSRARLGEQIRPAILSVLALTLLAGGIFPLLLLAIARPLFPQQCAGSLVRRGGAVIGVRLIGQEFTRREYFQPGPSAAGSGYDGTASGGTNLGPNNPKLVNGTADFAGVRQLAEEYRQRNGLLPWTPIPIDAVTRSGSGLDPHISIANALLQAPRVASTRGLSGEVVRRLVMDTRNGSQFGILGEPRVSVVELNLTLDELMKCK